MKTDSTYYIEKGYIDLSDDVAFKKIYEACNCFGHSYKGYQSGGAKHAVESDVLLWFPKFYENNTDWDNQISADGKVITERNKKSIIFQENDEWSTKRIVVFAHEPDENDKLMYRFKGVFKYDGNQRKPICRK